MDSCPLLSTLVKHYIHIRDASSIQTLAVLTTSKRRKSLYVLFSFLFRAVALYIALLLGHSILIFFLAKVTIPNITLSYNVPSFFFLAKFYLILCCPLSLFFPKQAYSLWTFLLLSLFHYFKRYLFIITTTQNNNVIFVI